MLKEYVPIIFMLLGAGAIGAIFLVGSRLIGPRNPPNPAKLEPFECGVDPVGTARQRFDVKFYLIAILFLVFDVELLFLYPWATVAYRDPPELAIIPAGLQTAVFWEVIVFLLTLVVAYVYAWRKGVFRWR